MGESRERGREAGVGVRACSFPHRGPARSAAGAAGVGREAVAPALASGTLTAGRFALLGVAVAAVVASPEALVFHHRGHGRREGPLRPATPLGPGAELREARGPVEGGVKSEAGVGARGGRGEERGRAQGPVGGDGGRAPKPRVWASASHSCALSAPFHRFDYSQSFPRLALIWNKSKACGMHRKKQNMLWTEG
ncbi:uncharacterized protein LOC128929351 [Callithrix jacchus]